MVGVNGSKYPAIRAHLEQNIARVYKDLDVSYVCCDKASPWFLELSFSFDSYPKDTETDAEACTL